MGVSNREHPHLLKRGLVRDGGSKPTSAIKPSGNSAVGAADDSRPCGTEAGKAAARREREARAGKGSGIDPGITAR